MMLLPRHYEEVEHARDEDSLQRALVDFAAELGFGQVSAVLMRGGSFDSPGAWGRSVGNPPEGYVKISRNLDLAARDPVLARLMKMPLPLVYDQAFYVQAGAGDIWETVAPFGYRTGVAMSMRLGGEHFMMGVDRPDALPKDPALVMRLLADLQLLGVHAQQSMSRLFAPPGAANDEAPRLTAREREVLRWSADGKSAWVVGSLLGITERGVHKHVQSAMRKLGVSSKTGAVLKAVERDLLN